MTAVRCASCGEREGTVRWGDALAVTHGFASMWCKVCAVSAQLDHARERAALIPELEAELAAALTPAPAAGEEGEAR